MKKVKIYALINPETEEIKYIGKTIRTLEQRLTNHICDAKSKRYKNYTINWINSLLKKNITPEIILIEEINYEDNWEWLEQYWISQFKSWNFNLTNLTIGGDGNKNQKFSKESQIKKSETIKKKILLGEISYKERSIKISNKLKGIKRSEITKNKVRLANLGKKYSLESKLKRAKTVLQYDLNGNFIKEWLIMGEASKVLKISKGAISNVCKNKQKTAGNFKWKYK